MAKASKKNSRKSKSGTKKRKVNAFIRLRNKSLKQNADSFKYKGKTYVRKQKKQLVYYALEK
tara:strand:- start:582 stop:767 length:186 start_codon:yes stop_codon:yes gene_type:complete